MFTLLKAWTLYQFILCDQNCATKLTGPSASSTITSYISRAHNLIVKMNYNITNYIKQCTRSDWLIHRPLFARATYGCMLLTCVLK